MDLDNEELNKNKFNNYKIMSIKKEKNSKQELIIDAIRTLFFHKYINFSEYYTMMKKADKDFDN